MRQGSNAEMASYGDASDHRSPGWPVNGGPETTELDPLNGDTR